MKGMDSAPAKSSRRYAAAAGGQAPLQDIELQAPAAKDKGAGDLALSPADQRPATDLFAEGIERQNHCVANYKRFA